MAGGDAPPPLYEKLFRRLRDDILRGGHRAGDLLPSEAELSKANGVSRITVRRALDELARRGLVRSEKGRGTRVLPRRLDGRPVLGGITGLLENSLAMGLETEVELVDFDYRPAPPDVAEALALAPGALVQYAVRVRHVHGQPFSHLTTYVPERFGRFYTREELAEQTLLTLLERAGTEVEKATQTISAEAASPRVARLLLVEHGTALMRMERVVMSAVAEPVQWITALYRPDIYHYRMDLQRDVKNGVAQWR